MAFGRSQIGAGTSPVADVDRRPRGAGLEHQAEVLDRHVLDRVVGDVRRPHVRHRRGRDLPFVDEELEELLERPVPIVGGARLRTSQNRDDERLDVVASDVRRGGRHALLDQDGGELRDRLGVGLDRPWGLVLRLEGGEERLGQPADVIDGNRAVVEAVVVERVMIAFGAR